MDRNLCVVYIYSFKKSSCRDLPLVFYFKRKEEDMSCDNLIITADELNQLTSMSPDDHLKALLLFDAGLDEGFIEAFIQSALVRYVSFFNGEIYDLYC